MPRGRSGGSKIEVLHESPSSRVYRAAGEPGVVFKELLGANSQRRLEHEEEVLAKLANVAGIVQLAASAAGARSANQPTLGMRDYGDATLARAVQRGAVPLAPLLAIAVSLTRALAAVHREGIVHRDICPANILLPGPEEPVIADFGAALMPGEVPDGEIAGTLGYLSPEQTGRTGRKVDHRSDLHGLGATLYEMATGRPAFEPQDALRMLHDHLVREPAAPALIDQRLPAALSDIVMRLLAKDPDDRYQGADGLLHDLLRLQTEWRSGRNSAFTLGEHDFASRLTAPATLVGRETELDVLRTAFDAARHSSRRTVLVEGAPGVGKSALIAQMRPQAVAAGGWFVYGKYDQYQREAASAGAVTQALRAIGRLLLAQPGEQQARHRERMLAALGKNAGLMTRSMPEYARLLGEQPDFRAADTRQAELQLQQAIVDVLDAVASAGHPLVVVLDDLQWAGPVSFRAFERLMNEPHLRGVLLVGIHRSADPHADDALAPMLERWAVQPQPPVRIELQGLPADDMAEFVARVLRLSPARASDLSASVHAFTKGNPFDTVEILNALRDDGALRLESSGWQWDGRAVRGFVGRGDVVDLLAVRIARLPSQSRSVLECMSCIGGRVESDLLMAATGLDDASLQEQLRAPLDDGLVLADAEPQRGWRFRHDRVQQAVLKGLGHDMRSDLQLQIARRLASHRGFEADAAHQYLGSASLLRDPAEKHRVAQLFHETARLLASSARHALAERYLALAGAFLSAKDAVPDAALSRAIDIARHAALHNITRLDEADAIYEAMQGRGDIDPVDLAPSACLQIRSLDMRGRSSDALAVGRSLLSRLGVAAPASGAEANDDAIAALQDWAAVLRSDASRTLVPPTPNQDACALAIASVLDRMLRTAIFMVDIRTATWIVLQAHRLWTQDGPCAPLVPCLCRTGVVFIVTRQDYRSGFDVATHVLAVGEALGFEPQTSEGRQITAIYCSHWVEPAEVTFQHAMRARAGLVHYGDPLSASFSYAAVSQALCDTAPTLEGWDLELDSGFRLAARAGNNYSRLSLLSFRQLLRCLRGQTDAPGSFGDDEFEPATYLAGLAAFPTGEAIYHLHRALAGVVFGNFRSAELHTEAALSLLRHMPGYYATMHAHLLRALVVAAQLRDGIGEPQSMVDELHLHTDWLAARAADQPQNFLHLLRLVQAETAWAQKDLWQASLAFDAALSLVETSGRPWQRALVTERAALFHLQQRMGHAGPTLLVRARDQYRAWGAHGKVAAMEGTHPWLANVSPGSDVASRPDARSSGGVLPETLDLMGVLRASQALSSETSLERLTVRVTEVLAALTGATHVSVLSWHDDQWWLLAPGRGERSMPAHEAAAHGLLSLAAVGYAERTGEALLVDDATRDERFASDPYFAGQSHCSLLVLPIASQGASRAMLLLENRLAHAAFNAQRLDAAMLIAGQLAVSLANVQLYETLEERVQARTRELRDTQAELVATARRAGMAEIANSVLHNVGNVLNSVNVSAVNVVTRMTQSKTLSLKRAMALMNEHAGDLAEFLSRDERGRTLPDYLNQLADALVLERGDILAELDRLTRNVDHIKAIVANQQAHAGKSSLVEMVRPHELIEEALHMSEREMAQHGVKPARHYEELPLLMLDKPRVLQILVNLMRNGAQAMGAAPSEARELVIEAGFAQGEGAERLRICVRDRGEGIASSDLERIFSHGFTTKKDGHGFGLHSSALAATEMGGRLTAHSDGPGRGAAFTLELPVGGVRS